jgi:2,5-diketo-D-gluconate reductase A
LCATGPFRLRALGFAFVTNNLAPTRRLLYGAAIPLIGLGTYPMDDAVSERVIADAIGAGYRLVDTAEAYGNERGVGRGISASGIDRGELFITSKFDKKWHARDKVRDAFERSTERLGLDYLDLLLIHWPNPAHDRYIEAWEGLVDLLGAGQLKAIGVSNFKPAHLTRIIDATGVAPDINQIQLSPVSTRVTTRAFDEQHGIVTESWSPIGGPGVKVLDNPVVAAIAAKHDRSRAQTVLRWHVELDLVPIPKSADAKRLRENLDVFNFALSADDVDALSALDRGDHSITDSDTYGH